jgi:hypothetical protein
VIDGRDAPLVETTTSTVSQLAVRSLTFGPGERIAIFCPSGDQLRSMLLRREVARSSLRPVPSGWTSQSESRWSMYAISLPSGDHAYAYTFVFGGVTGRSPLPSARTTKSCPPKSGPGARRTKAIVPARFEAAARLAAEAVVSVTATPVTTARTASLGIARTVENSA